MEITERGVLLAILGSATVCFTASSLNDPKIKQMASQGYQIYGPFKGLLRQVKFVAVRRTVHSSRAGLTTIIQQNLENTINRNPEFEILTEHPHIFELAEALDIGFDSALQLICLGSELRLWRFERLPLTILQKGAAQPGKPNTLMIEAPRIIDATLPTTRSSGLGGGSSSLARV